MKPLNFVLTSAIIAICFSFSSAQNKTKTTKGFSYQAVARDANGELMSNKTLNVRISLIENTETGKVIYQEEHSAVTNQFGLFTLKVGQGKVSTGSMDNVKWGQFDYFIKIEADIKGGNNYSLLGTSQILAAPYALRALEAEQFVDNGSNSRVSLGDWSLMGNSGTIPGTDFIGTTDSVDIVFKTNNTERMRITRPNTTLTSKTSFGIGTTTPNSIGTGQVTGDVLHIKSSGSHAKIILESGSTGTPGFILYQGAGTPNSRMMQHVVTLGTYVMRAFNDNVSIKYDMLTASLSTGNVAIGASPSTTYKFLVSGTLKSNGITESSDIRWKKNIQTLENSLDKVLSLRGVNYEWKKEKSNKNNFEKGTQLGLIAQEVEIIVPEVVNTDNNGYKSIQYSHLVALLIEAIKEQQKIIETQKLTIANNSEDLKSLKAQVNSIIQILDKNNLSSDKLSFVSK